MIPKIIHQTWRDYDLPVPESLPESWRKMNPDWQYRFWTDEDLENLVVQDYPELLDYYLSVPKPVQRADIARYLIIHKYGGIYADIDTECFAPLDVLADEDRVILCEEPPEHWKMARACGMDALIFNGTFASPAGHPFWDHVQKTLVRMMPSMNRVLESTGPLMLTGCVITYPQPEQISVSSCHLFDPMFDTGAQSAGAVHGDYGAARISTHLWTGTWHNFKPATEWQNRLADLKKWPWKIVYHITRGRFLDRKKIEASINRSLLASKVPNGPEDDNIAVLIPVRDAEEYLERCFELIAQLDYPKDRLKLVFCEGDSSDNTVAVLARLKDKYAGVFRDIKVLHLTTGNRLKRQDRWRPRFQKKRRSGLAKVRNHLIENGLDQSDRWALWIDADVCDYQPDVLRKLLAAKDKIVIPECVRQPGGVSYDLNTFVDYGSTRNAYYYRHAVGGIFQPQAKFGMRRHMYNLRFLDRVLLNSVGGTMLLVHADVHRAGVTFPDIPYNDLLETEGFAAIATDFGVQPIGLPNVHIQHI